MPIQGTAADIIKIAMLNISHRLYELNLSSKIITILFISISDLIETYNLNLMAGNIEGDQSPEVFSNFIFECDDVQAVRDSHEADWKYYKDGGCTGIDIHRISGGDYASNNTFMFCARFKSMEDLGANWDKMGESSYGKDLSDYHSKIKIIKNFNGRSLKFERFKS